jgi:hypothetical protein
MQGAAICREKSHYRRKKALGVKTRNDADRGRVAAHKMRCDGVLDGEMMLTQIMGRTKPYDRRYSWV